MDGTLPAGSLAETHGKMVVSEKTGTVHMLALVPLRGHGPQWAESWCAQWVHGCGWTGSSCSMLSCFAFCPLSNALLIGVCNPIVICAMSRVYVEFVGECCEMSSDGVWGVDDAVCVSLSTPKKRQHSTRPCLHVMMCTNVSCCMVGGG